MTKRHYLEIAFFLSLFLALLFSLWPFSNILPEANLTDDGQFILDLFDRNTIDKIFSLSTITYDENSNAHFIPLNNLLFKMVYFLNKELSVSLYLIVALVHFFNSIILFKISQHFFKSLKSSYLIVLTFIFFPVKNEVLSWFAAGFNHTFTLLFCLLSTYFWIKYLRDINDKYFLLSILYATLAFMLKPLAYFLPFSLLCLSLFVKEVPTLPGQIRILPLKTLCRIYCMLFVLSLFILAESYKYPAGSIARQFGGLEFGIHPLLRILDLFTYPLSFNSSIDFLKEVAMFFLLFLLVSVLMFGLYRKKGIILFWLSWICGSSLLMLSGNFRNIDTILRYQYFPFTGLIFLLFYFFDLTFNKKSYES